MRGPIVEEELRDITGTRYKNKLGNLYTSLVMQAWTAGRITNHNAAEFMGIKNLQHLRDIRSEYQK